MAMENSRFISIKNISSHYNVEISFIQSLGEYGLIEITRIEEDEVMDTEYLGQLEKMMRLHYDLEINMPGIDAIAHLLKRIQEMQEDVRHLKNKLGQH